MESAVSAASALAAVSAAPAAARSPWIVSREFDLAFIFGGALLSLVAVGLTLGAGVSMAAVYWLWLFVFDGPHFAAAYTRTYADRAEWRARRGMLLGTIVVSFAVGPIALAANVATGTNDPFLLYLGFAALYGVYHVVRQHYGFLALYKAAARDYGRLDFHIDKWALYAGCWAPYVWFMVTHPRARKILQLPSDGPLSAVEQAIAWLAVGAFAAAVVLPLGRALARAGARALGEPKVLYLLFTDLLYGATFFWLATREPVYSASRGPDEDFLLLNVVTVVYHDIQYVALVWWHNRNRYHEMRGTAATGAPVPEDARARFAAAVAEFGPARWVSGSYVSFAFACLAFSAVYCALACWTGVFPHCALFPELRLGPVTSSQIGLCLWWGLALHHYILDQKIWRVRGDPVLKANLGLA
jgi:hypothetical protein